MTKNNKDTFWFTHDSNAHSDSRILELLHRHDWQGYGCYWCIIELLRDSPKYRISINLIDALLWQKRIDKKIFETLLEIGLLKNDDKFIFSESLLNRMQYWDLIKKSRSNAGKQSGKIRRLKKEQNHTITNEHCSNKTPTLFEQNANTVRTNIEQDRIEQNRIEHIDNKKKFDLKPAEPTTKTKTIAEKYIDSINAITGRKGNPIKTILPEVEKRLRQGIEPWKIIAAPLILKASTIHPGLWKRENIYSILLRDGSKPVRGINGGPSQPGVDWINSAIEAIDTVHFDAQKVAIAIDLEIWSELKDKIKSFEEPNYAE